MENHDSEIEELVARLNARRSPEEREASQRRAEQHQHVMEMHAAFRRGEGPPPAPIEQPVAPRDMGDDIRYTARWWALSVVHNMVVHPLLPAADALHAIGLRRAAQIVYDWHDKSAPMGAS